jgi:hypothetical protein
MNRMVTTFVLVCLQSAVSVKEARDAYFKSSNGPDEAQKFKDLLDRSVDNATPVLLCYKGAAEMLKAKNAVNPMSKYSFFNRGKRLIEEGLSRDTSSVESRFIRFSIQRNLPGFLGYNRNIVPDSLFVEKMLPYLQDGDLKFKITEYFCRQRNGDKN